MDYESIAKQYGGTTAVDYAALAKQFGGTSAAPAQAAPAAPADDPFPVKLGRQVLGAAAGLGKGAGTVAMGAQELAGRGLSVVGMDKAGDWLQKDAQAGRSKLAGEFAPYKADAPIAAGAGELGGELIATWPVGGLIAKGLSAVPGVAARIPNMLNAIRTSGMVAGEGGNALANIAARSAGGAITGGASAALVDPNSAGTGAIIGGALPVVTKIAGMAGQKIGGLIRGPAQTSDMTAAVQAARANGYVIPPTQASPTLGNRLIEGFSGKITTAQNASAKNQAVTSGLAAKELGLAADAKITPDVLTGIRQQAGQAYDAIGSTGAVTPSATYNAALDKIAAPFVKSAQAFPNAKPSQVLDLVESLRSPSFDAAAAVEKIKQLRTAADDAFRTGNTDIGRASKASAGALEDAIDGHLQSVGQPGMLQAFRDARQLIAKTYSVENALNPVTGAVDARKLAGQLAKNKPLSGGLKDAAEFAARFPKASQTVEGMGSLPQTSPLDWIGAGTLSGVTGNPLVMLGALARPAARAAALSPMVQNRLAQTASNPNALQRLLENSDLAQLGYRAAPVMASGR